MIWNIIVHVDEGDKEFLETPESKLALEQTIYRRIQDLKQMHFDRLSRAQPRGSFIGVSKKGV
jgi:hypothetical protein